VHNERNRDISTVDWLDSARPAITELIALSAESCESLGGFRNASNNSK
jgi:hypothetical protein